VNAHALDLDALSEAALVAALAGGEVVLAGFGRAGREVRTKGPGDWVSAVDHDSENAIRRVLESTGFPVFGEERGGEQTDTGWLVDPLDGTTNFLHHLEAVGVSIALCVEDVPMVGVVHAPVMNRTYTAVLGRGARRDGEPIRVSERQPAEAVVATGFPFRRKDTLDGFIPVVRAALDEFEDLRRVGAASLDLCWTAAGVFDGYFERGLGPWDVAAGALVVTEAGGVVTDWAGDPRAWLRAGEVVAGPPAVHERLLALVKPEF